MSAGKKPAMEYDFPVGELVVNASGTRREQPQLCETFPVKKKRLGLYQADVEAEEIFFLWKRGR